MTTPFLTIPKEVQHKFGIKTTQEVPDQKFDAVVLTVAHKEFLNMDMNALKSKGAVVYDVKGVLENVDGKL